MIRVGIFFGGFSREREVSFASGRTLYDNLDRSLFSPVPIFVDSRGAWILLPWQDLYRGSIQDFYPPPALVSAHKKSTSYDDLYVESFSDDVAFLRALGQAYKVIHPHEIAHYIDFAFITLHGVGGEDGSIQGLLEWYNIPYSGSGIRASGVGMDKAWQKHLLEQAGWADIPCCSVAREDWLDNPSACLRAAQKIPAPWVVKPAKEGSSVGVTRAGTQKELQAAIDKAFFLHTLFPAQWNRCSDEEKKEHIKEISSLKRGLGLPILLDGVVLFHPNDLLAKVTESMTNRDTPLRLEACLSEHTVLVEQAVHGREFSCIVVEDPKGKPVALLPTEILKKNSTYDYRAKYLSGTVRKNTPIALPAPDVQRIRRRCEALYRLLGLEVYARIDGFFSQDFLYLNDPNTTSGLQLSSFFFHQAAVLGVSPTAFLRWLVEASLRAETRRNKRPHAAIGLLKRLQEGSFKSSARPPRTKVAIITGGETSERHIAIESARNIYEKLAASSSYEPVPFFLLRQEKNYVCCRLPVPLLLKDNAVDIEEKIRHPAEEEPIVGVVRKETQALFEPYAEQKGDSVVEKVSWAAFAKQVDVAFIAMHGRPGEDGVLQRLLERYKIPYNGSRSGPAALMMDKYATQQKLHAHGIQTTDARLILRNDYEEDKNTCVREVERAFSYPIVLKPQDDGCSTGVCKVEGRKELLDKWQDYFCSQPAADSGATEYAPLNSCLAEAYVCAGQGERCWEITVGLLAHYRGGGVVYEVFEPSEVLKSGALLSLEEKFLTGAGKNITPVVFSTNSTEHRAILKKVKDTVKQTAIALQVEGYARVDAFVKRGGEKIEVLVIEVNALPGMTAATCIFHQAALAGYAPSALIDRILCFAIQRKEQNEKLLQRN